jgi:sugar/nucleoside kinase (ribokinase family)
MSTTEGKERTQSMFDVVGIGLNAVDYLVGLPRFPVPGEKLRMSAFAREGGGQVATALVALSRWGCRCKYVGNVGDDEHGRLSSLLLSREGIDIAHLRTVPGATSQFAVILVEDGTGERTILWDRDPRIRVSPEDLPIGEIRRARALLLDGHDVSPSIAAARAARAAGVPVVLDAEKVQDGTEELLSLSDHIVAAGHFPGLLFPANSPEDGARKILRRYGPRTSTVTLGPRGAFGCDGREEIFSPSIRVRAVDTTGAGDIFHAGFLNALLGGLPFREILAFANAAAGLSCRGMGGRAAIPSVGEIRAACVRGGARDEDPLP